MFAYAVVSIRARDYEQAIATLERMLIYRDDLPRVKLELGSAYFRLGSYEVSSFYFKEALAGDPPLRNHVKLAQGR
jgi:tetratricopeptide (TPR) repeat protein